MRKLNKLSFLNTYNDKECNIYLKSFMYMRNNFINVKNDHF